METGTTDDAMVAFVRKQLGISDNNLREAITTLRTWLEKQPHLPKQIDERRLEGLYINCKCSLERTKRSIDAYFSFKSTFPDLLTNRDPTRPEMQRFKNAVKIFAMPRLTPEGYRVLVNTEITPDPSQLQFEMYIKAVMMLTDLALVDDRCLGDIVIIDLLNFDVGHIANIGVSHVKAAETIYREAYCRRVKAVHFLNPPKVMDMLLSICKYALPEKIRKRIIVHLPGSDALLQYIPRESLPDQLGGCGGNVADLHEESWQRLGRHREWLLGQDELQVDESKRPVDSRRPEDMYGLDGSFRKLDID